MGMDGLRGCWVDELSFARNEASLYTKFCPLYDYPGLFLVLAVSAPTLYWLPPKKCRRDCYFLGPPFSDCNATIFRNILDEALTVVHPLTI
ncbi:hypothetical protein DL98DRAFT_168803 [Cadophora sp. DSE1049]|nr:hypothetical protein DL98DRAFT_168803 [Cadophora sp. DSE1049]